MTTTKRIQYIGKTQPVSILPESTSVDRWFDALSVPMQPRPALTASQMAFAWGGFTPTAPLPPPVFDAARIAAVALLAGLHPSRQASFIWSTFTPPSAVVTPPTVGAARQAAVPAHFGLHPSRQQGFIWSSYPPAIVPAVNDAWYRDLSIPFMPRWSGGT